MTCYGKPLPFTLPLTSVSINFGLTEIKELFGQRVSAIDSTHSIYISRWLITGGTRRRCADSLQQPTSRLVHENI